MPNHNLYQMARYNHTSLHNSQAELVFEQVVREYYPYIHRLALSILNDLQDADDVAQETFIAAHHSLATFRQESSLKTWLSTIAMNACRSKLRKRKIRQVLDSTLQALHLLKNPPPSPEQVAIQQESDQAIWHAVDALNEKHRLPIILRYVLELDTPEIASLLQLNQGTVHSRLHYARKKLHADLRYLNPHQEVQDEPTR